MVQCWALLLLGSFLDAVVDGLTAFLLGATFLVTSPAVFLGGHGDQRLDVFFLAGVRFGRCFIRCTVST